MQGIEANRHCMLLEFTSSYNCVGFDIVYIKSMMYT